MTEKLNELSATRSGDETESKAVDPRWAKLADFKLGEDDWHSTIEKLANHQNKNIKFIKTF